MRPGADSALLFFGAAMAEIAGAYLVWRGLRGGLGTFAVVVGAGLLTAYGVLAALQPDPHFGRVLAAYGGVFIVGSLLWGVAFDGFRPDRYDIAGAAVCLAGAALIAWAPRAAV